MGRKVEIKGDGTSDELQLIKDAQAGERMAFNKIVLKYQDTIFNLCFRMLGDYDEANDCAQDAFIKVYKNIKSFQFKSSFSTWLYRVAVNTCKNHLTSASFRMRKKMVRLDNPGHNDENSRGAGSASPLEIRDETANPAKVYEKKEKEMMVQNAIESLSSKERVLIVLRDIEGKSYEEISKITGVKQGTVKSRLSRARNELRDKLKGVL